MILYVVVGIFVALILAKFKIGAEKEVHFSVPADWTSDQTKKVITYFCEQNQWRLIKERKSTDGGLEFLFQVGQWGLSFSGSQIVFVGVGRDGSCHVVSKSTMGQLADWGKNKKNLDSVQAFFEGLKNDSKKIGEIMSAPATSFSPAKTTVNPSFWLLAAVLVILLFGYAIWSRYSARSRPSPISPPPHIPF